MAKVYSVLFLLVLVPHIIVCYTPPPSLVTPSTPVDSASELTTANSGPSALKISSVTAWLLTLLRVTQIPFASFLTPAGRTKLPVFLATDPLYPPPVSSDQVIVPDFAPAWIAAYLKARALISDYTVEQKIAFTTGIGWQNGPCLANIPPVVNFPGLCMQDSPTGVRFTDLVSAFPAGVTIASTWNRALMRAHAVAMGQEFKAKGAHVAPIPTLNLVRTPQGGRNWESFGADPFLSGEAGYEFVLGIQSTGVQANAKHYINNEQEHMRTLESSNVDDRTQHEVYAHPFMRSVMAGVSSVMCSYNLVNYTYACENNKILNDILKREFGFRGYVMSDWWATMSTMSAAAGLDITMPGDINPNSGDSYFGANLTAYVMNQTVSMTRLDDMVTRIAAAWYYMHQDEGHPELTIDSWNLHNPINRKVNAQNDHANIIREVATAGIVLLKNEGVLPLNKPESISLVGSDAAPPMFGPNEYPDHGGDPTGILAAGWGSGTTRFMYLVSPYEAIQARAKVDQTILSWNFDNWDLDRAANAVVGQEVAIVFVNSASGERYITVDGNQGDRKNLTAWHGGDELILAVASQNNNTIVVTSSVGPLIIEPWVEHPNVTAIVWANLGGNEAGNAIADVLYGNWNPSGRLPYTIAKKTDDYPAQLTLGNENGTLPDDYTEGLFIDYRWFDAKNITPRYEFGFGLSYSAFEYSRLQITPVLPRDVMDKKQLDNWHKGGATPIAEGSTTAPWLHMPAFQVTFDVKNIGDYHGFEASLGSRYSCCFASHQPFLPVRAQIPQLYLHHDPSQKEPPSILKGFTNIELAPGQKEPISITLSRYDLSTWDVIRQGWVRPKGNIQFSIGASSRDFRLKGVIRLQQYA